MDFTAADFAKVWAQGGDYDTGPGLTLDGPLIGKAVEGGEMLRHLTEDYDGRNTNPDFNQETFEFSLENTNNSPNRQITSAVMFGSLAVGGSPQESWRTLLFSPNPNSKGQPSLSEVSSAGSIPTAGCAPDFLLLDFFSMPVVEPYAISEPFSTAGRVNMNVQLAPFTHIRRDTALRGVLRTAMLAAVEDRWVQSRKVRGFQGRYSDGPGAVTHSISRVPGTGPSATQCIPGKPCGSSNSALPMGTSSVPPPRFARSGFTRPAAYCRRS